MRGQQRKQAIDVLEDMLDTMEKPNVGIKEQADEFEKVNYDEDLNDAFDPEIPEGLPRVSTWHILIAPCKPRTMSKGGIALPNQVIQAEDHLNYLGRIAAIGPLAGSSEKFHVITNRFLYWITAGHFGWKSCWNYKVGDLVLFGTYSGQKIFYRGTHFRLVNDDRIEGDADSPKGFKIYAG